MSTPYCTFPIFSALCVGQFSLSGDAPPLPPPAPPFRLSCLPYRISYVVIPQVDSAARLLQGAMRSFVFRRQTLSKRPTVPPLPPRGGNSSALSTIDDAEALFATADAATSAGDGRRGGGAGGQPRQSRQSSRKSVAGAVGGGWEASGAHVATTLADVFPPEEEDDEGAGRRVRGARESHTSRYPREIEREGGGGVGVGSDGGGFGSNGGVTKGVSLVVQKFLDGPALERFGGGGGEGASSAFSRKSSVATMGGRRSTVTFAAAGRRSSAASVRFVEGGRRSTVGGWGENDEAARPGATVCKDCLSDVASLLALAMTPEKAARTVMEVSLVLEWNEVGSGQGVCLMHSASGDMSKATCTFLVILSIVSFVVFALSRKVVQQGRVIAQPSKTLHRISPIHFLSCRWLDLPSDRLPFRSLSVPLQTSCDTTFDPRTQRTSGTPQL